MKYEAQLEEMARDEDREFAFLDSEMNVEKFYLELFCEDYDPNNVE